MSLKIKLISVVSAFILVLSMLLVGVLAATGSFTINLKGNVEFNIDDSNLYIKDIRLSDGQTEGETIKNFMPGFVGEILNLTLAQSVQIAEACPLKLTLSIRQKPHTVQAVSQACQMQP